MNHRLITMDIVLDNADKSFLPTAMEVSNAVKWIRTNPGLTLGLVIGLTGFSIAKFYDLMYADESNQNSGAKFDMNNEHVNNSKPKVSSLLSNTSTTSSDKNEKDTWSLKINASQASLHSVKSLHDLANHTSKPPECVSQLPAEMTCCDSDWGWFVPTCSDEDC